MPSMMRSGIAKAMLSRCSRVDRAGHRPAWEFLSRAEAALGQAGARHGRPPSVVSLVGSSLGLLLTGLFGIGHRDACVVSLFSSDTGFHGLFGSLLTALISRP